MSIDRSSALAPQQARSRETRRRLLDSAVDVLVNDGYAAMTTPEVARRAGVSRGAQQGHFATRLELVRAAIGHLTARQAEELDAAVARLPRGRRRLGAILDVAYEQYAGELLRAMLELSLAARTDDGLQGVITDAERAVAKTIIALRGIVGDPATEASVDPDAWATAISTARGTALLKLLGHPAAHVDRQWVSSRRHLVGLITAPAL